MYGGGRGEEDLSKAGRVKSGRVIQLGGRVIAAILADSLIWLVPHVSWLIRPWVLTNLTIP